MLVLYGNKNFIFISMQHSIEAVKNNIAMAMRSVAEPKQLRSDGS